MTRAEGIERAARIAMHWFDPEGEAQHTTDPDLSPRDMYWLLRDALDEPDPPKPNLKAVA